VRYVRHDAIPGLADSLDGQRTTSPQAAVSLGDRFLVVGSITDLTKPTLSVEPAAWTTDGSSVTTDALPAPGGQLGGPTALACARPEHGLPGAPKSVGSCVAAGLLTAQGRDVLAAWTIGVLDRTIESRPIDVSACRPPAAAPDPGESTPRPPRVRVSIGLGASWIVVATSAAGVACRVDGQTAVPVALPTGCVPVAVQAPQSPGGTGSLICADAEGVTTYRQR
jgi:hypothetical protein